MQSESGPRASLRKAGESNAAAGKTPAWDKMRMTGQMFLSANVYRSPRQTAATREAPAAVWRRAGGRVGQFHSFESPIIEPGPDYLLRAGALVSRFCAPPSHPRLRWLATNLYCAPLAARRQALPAAPGFAEGAHGFLPRMAATLGSSWPCRSRCALQAERSFAEGDEPMHFLVRG